VTAIGKQLQHPRGLFGKALFRWMSRATIGHGRWTADLMDVQPEDDVLEIGFGNARTSGSGKAGVQGLRHRSRSLRGGDGDGLEDERQGH
jgi:hypothetical protein